MPAAGELVERVIALGHRQLDAALELLCTDAEWVPEPGGPAVRGRDAIRAHVEDERARHGEPLPEALPMLLVEDGDRVVVFGQTRTPREHGKRAYVEVAATAWLYELHDGSIARVRRFGSWDAARVAARIPAGAGASRRLP